MRRALAALLGSAVLAGSSGALAQAPATPQEILAMIAEVQKVQGKLEGEIRGLRGQLDAEVRKLKSWTVLNAEQRIIEWRMTAANVEIGFFAHDIVAQSEMPGIEVRCQVTAGDDNKNLATQFLPGTEFTCTGAVGAITPSAEKTVITLRQSKLAVVGQRLHIEPTGIPNPEISMHTAKLSEGQVKAAIEAFKKACAPLFSTHAADIVKVRASAGEPMGLFRIEQWGWGAEIHLTVELKQAVSTFPPEVRANGHTLHYFLGGGLKPGVQVQKRVSEIACGLAEAPGRREDAFMSIPALASILPRAT